MNGFYLYNIALNCIVQNFSQKTINSQRRLPKEAAFSGNGTTVVGGSNHGLLYVWDRSNGALLQQMKHPDGGLVQTVTVSFRIFVVPLNLNAVCNKAFERFDRSYFASASSGENEAISIYLWKRERPFNTDAITSLYEKYLQEPAKLLYRFTIWYILAPTLAFLFLLAAADAFHRNVSHLSLEIAQATTYIPGSCTARQIRRRVQHSAI